MAKFTFLNFKAAYMDAAIKKAAGKLEVIEAPTGNFFQVEVEFDNAISKDIEKDPLVQQEMHDEAKEVYDDAVKDIGKLVKDADKEAIELRDEGKLDKIPAVKAILDREIQNAMQEAGTSAKDHVKKVWEELQKKRKEYKAYKIKAGISVGAGVSGLGVSIAMVASGGFTGGASAAFGIIGIIKSTTALAEQITSLALDAEQAIKLVQKEVDLLYKYIGVSEAKNKGMQANEYAAAVIKTFVGISQPTVARCGEHVEVAKKKVIGIEVKCHAAAKDLNEMLSEMDKLQKDFLAEAAKLLAKHPSPKAPGQISGIKTKLEARLKPIEKHTNEKIEQVLALRKRVQATEEQLGDLESKLEFMEGEIDTKKPGYLELALKAIDIPLALIGDGNAMVKSAQEFAVNVAPAVGDFVIEHITNKVFEGSFLE